MRNNTTLAVALGACLLISGSVRAQPAPFPPTLELNIVYHNFPAASGDYTFTFDPVLYYYVHDGLPNSFGRLEWDGPFVPQGVQGEFVHSAGRYFTFNGTWFDDGFLVTSVQAGGVTVTGTLVPEPSGLALLLPLAALAGRRRR
jgi:hypothetical protein